MHSIMNNFEGNLHLVFHIYKMKSGFDPFELNGFMMHRIIRIISPKPLGDCFNLQSMFVHECRKLFIKLKEHRENLREGW